MEIASSLFFSKRELEDFAYADKIFSSKDPESSKILKLSYIALCALYQSDRNIDDLMRKQEEGKIKIKYSGSSIYYESVVHMIWDQLLDFSELNTCRIKERKHATKSFWRNFITEEERDQFLQKHISHQSNKRMIFKGFGEEENNHTIRKQLLSYIQEKLVRYGFLHVLVTDKSSVYGKEVDKKKIVFDHRHCYEYGVYLFEESNDFPPHFAIQKEKAFNMLKDAIIFSCLKVTSDAEDATLSQKDYALKRLPYHLLDVGRCNEALELLFSQVFFNRRVSISSVRVASMIHGKDCLSLHHFLNQYCEKEINEKVVSCFFKIIEFLEHIRSVRNEGDFEFSLCFNGLLLEEIERINEALLFYETVLQYQMSSKNIKTEVAFTLSRLGNIYVTLSNYEESFKCFEDAMNMQKEYFGKFHQEVAQTCGKIAKISVLQKKYKSAFRYYDELLEIETQLHGGRSLRVALVLNDIANLNYFQHDLENAIRCYKEALEIMTINEAKNHHLVSSISLKMGNIYSEMGDHNSAIDYYNKTLSSRKNYDGKNHRDITDVLEAKGHSYLEMNNMEASVRCFKNALLVAKSFQHNEGINKIQNKLGIALQIYGSYDEALRVYEEKVDQATQKNDLNDQNQAELFYSMGQCYEGKKDYRKAIEFFLKTVEISTEKKLNIKVATKLQEIGDAFLLENSVDLSMGCFIQAKKVWKKLKGSDRSAMADLQRRLGIVFIKQSCFKQARSCLTDALRIKRLNHEKDSEEVSDLLHDLGIVEKMEKNYSSAMKRCLESLSIRKHVFGDYHIKIAESLHILGAIMVKVENYPYASCYFQDAIKIYRKCGLEDTHFYIKDVFKCVEYLKECRDVKLSMNGVKAVSDRDSPEIIMASKAA